MAHGHWVGMLQVLVALHLCKMQLLLRLLLLANRLGWLPVEDLLLKNLEELHVAWNGFEVSSM
jgi:hypothetical protein